MVSEKYKRLFVAIPIQPSDEFLKTISFLQRNCSRDLINWIRKDHYHITLQFLGKTPVHRIEKICGQLRDIASKNDCFPLEIADLGVFGSQYQARVLWFGLSQHKILRDIHRQIEEKLSSHLGQKKQQNFVPHLSIARIKKIEDRAFFQQVIQYKSAVKIQSLMVNELLLFESVLSSKGAEYSIIEKFPFRS